MTQTPIVQPQIFDYYSVIENFVFEVSKPFIQSAYTYEENGVLYCASGTQKGVYRYSYCLNNPLKYKDPSGNLYSPVDDIWDVDRSGNVVNHTKTTKFDQIRVVDENKNVIDQTEQFKYGTIKHTRPPINYDGVLKALDLFAVKGDANAQQVFELFANNTNVEWGWVKVGFENSGRNIVGTSHSADSESVGSFLFKTGYTMREHNHNHPSGNPKPSIPTPERDRGDLKGLQPWVDKFPNLQLNIYINEGGKYGYPKGYYNYNKFGPTW